MPALEGTANAYLVHLTLQHFAHSVRIADAYLIVGDADEFTWQSMSVSFYQQGARPGKRNGPHFLCALMVSRSMCLVKILCSCQSRENDAQKGPGISLIAEK